MTLTFEAPVPRLSAAMLLAAPLVYALFLMAGWLIKVDEIVLTGRADRPLPTLTPTPPDEVFAPRPRLELAPPADKPPPPPALQVSTEGTAPMPVFVPPASDVFATLRLTPPEAAVPALAGRNIQVVRAPVPSMPRAAITSGLSGECEVIFDVDTRGRPFNLVADCSDPIFESEALRAVGKAEFLPKINAQGIPVEQHGAIYPIAFRVE